MSLSPHFDRHTVSLPSLGSFQVSRESEAFHLAESAVITSAVRAFRGRSPNLDKALDQVGFLLEHPAARAHSITELVLTPIESPAHGPLKSVARSFPDIGAWINARTAFASHGPTKELRQRAQALDLIMEALEPLLEAKLLLARDIEGAARGWLKGLSGLDHFIAQSRPSIVQLGSVADSSVRNDILRTFAKDLSGTYGSITAADFAAMTIGDIVALLAAWSLDNEGAKVLDNLFLAAPRSINEKVYRAVLGDKRLARKAFCPTAPEGVVPTEQQQFAAVVDEIKRVWEARLLPVLPGPA
jgi:hypothetical protein